MSQDKISEIMDGMYCILNWQAALVLNASRRFRYTLDLKKEEDRKQIIRKIRAHAQVIRAAYLFKEAGDQANGIPISPPIPNGDYGIGQEELASMTRDNNSNALQQYDGARLAELLKTNLEKGILGDDADLLRRRNAFGSNTYPRKKGRSFWMFLWEAWQDLTLIILMIAAIASLALGIKTEGIKEGWYDGGSIAFAVILVIVVTGSGELIAVVVIKSHLMEVVRIAMANLKPKGLSNNGAMPLSGLRINLAKSEIIPVGEVDEILEMAVELGCKGVARRLEKLQRDFLWGGGSTERKAHLVSWEKVCVSKEKGGLGLRKIAQLNKALLGKWVWRFARAKDEMWKRVLVAKYGQEDFGWEKGTKIRFWKDTWCGDVELAPELPSTLQCGCPKRCHCGGLMDQNAGQGEWNLRFLRSFNDWELPLVEELLQILRNQRINLEEDLAVWKGGKNGQFGVKDAYGLLTSHSTLLFPKKGIWVENVPSKLAFFAWEATWGRILTIDRLQKRG
ncbi:Calcium-transporting ATPase 10, plasma membrane-type [Vitis vinifera]|uniref:Calcium-transporting ATPase 10, plasma membrane-type n=1 Tax=Vitis vinifera TaxID=29760 RepID=A0A438CY86_VITVI|nr:Calcium-transporting ATPase 10, plasma membrane-type [Vitis vinifera]